MHAPQDNRLTEEVAFERAITSIDPLLRASLVRDQRRRRWRWLLAGGIVMISVVATWILATAMQVSPVTPPGSDGAKGDTNAQSAAAGTAGKTQPTAAQIAEAASLGKAAWQLWQSGDGAAAEAKFDAATQLDSRDANLWNGLGWSRLQQQKLDAAQAAFATCVKLNAKHPAGLNGLGQVLLQGGKLAEAEKVFLKAARTAPAARFGLARVQLLLGKYDAAAASLKALTKQGTGEIDPQLLKGMRLAASSKQLSEELREQLAPSAHESDEQPAPQNANPLALNQQGWQLFNQGENRQAEIAFRAAVEAKPDFLAAKNGLGFTLLNQHKIDEALPLFEELVTSDPKHLGFVNGLARCYAEQGKLERAVELWRGVDRPNGPVTACTWGLARSLTELEQYDEAIQLWTRIQAETPADKSIDAMLAKCRAGKSQADE